MSNIGARGVRDPGWRPLEDETIRRLWSTGGAYAVHEALPHRSINAIKHRACVTGISRQQIVDKVAIEPTLTPDRVETVEVALLIEKVPKVEEVPVTLDTALAAFHVADKMVQRWEAERGRQARLIAKFRTQTSKPDGKARRVG